MKYFGSTADFTDERNADLMRAYRKFVSSVPYFCITRHIRDIVNMPSSRFWVSEERATVVLSAMFAGRPVLRSMRSSKREMFSEIHRRVCDIRKSNPSMSLQEAVATVIYSPAPRFYIEPRSAIEIIYKIKKGFYDKQYRRNSH